MPSNDPHHLVAIMFVDVAGYSKIMGNDEQYALNILKEIIQLVRKCVSEHNGIFHKELGDGALIHFRSATEAVRCGLRIQTEVTENLEIALKIAIHLGDVILSNGDILGDGVNLTSRLIDITKAGKIFITESVDVAIAGKINVKARFIGLKSFRNISYPVGVYTIESSTAGIVFPPASFSWTKTVMYLATFILIIGIGLLINRFYQPKLIKDNIKKLAILPVKSLSADPETQYFSEGMIDVILMNLSLSNDLHVVPRTSMDQFRDGDYSVHEIGEIVGANYLLEASVFRFEDELKLVFQLIDVSEDTYIWSSDYSGSWDNLISWEEELSLEIVDELNVRLSPRAKKEIRKLSQVDPLAHEYLLKGMGYRNQTLFDREFFDLARRMFEQAISIDSNYSLAWTTLARLEMDYYQRNFDRSELQLKKINDLIASANDVESYELSKTRIRFEYSINRDYWTVISICGDLLEKMPEYSDDWLFDRGLAYRRLGNFDLAAVDFSNSLKVDSMQYDTRLALAQTLSSLGRFREADDEFRTIQKVYPDWTSPYFSLAYNSIMKSGRTDEARDIINKPFLKHSMQWKKNMIQLAIYDRDFQSGMDIIRDIPSNIKPSESNGYFSPEFYLAFLNYYEGHSDSTRFFAAQAINQFELLNLDFPWNNDLKLNLALSYALYGECAKAMSLAQEVVQEENTNIDFAAGLGNEASLMRVYVICHQFDQALKLLNEYLRLSRTMNVEFMKIDPFFDPLRNLESFKNLINDPDLQVTY